jgi:hypothetical protein
MSEGPKLMAQLADLDKRLLLFMWLAPISITILWAGWVVLRGRERVSVEERFCFGVFSIFSLAWFLFWLMGAMA